SLSRCRWNRLLVPTGTVSSNSMMLSLVSWPTSFRAAKRPGAPMSRCFPPPVGTTRPVFASISMSSPVATARRLWRAATRRDPTRDRPRPSGRRLARPTVRRRAASGRSTEEWPRPCTTTAARRARARERTAPLRSRNPGPRRRGPACSRAPSRRSARRQRAPVRARTILCESGARIPWIRPPCPSSRSVRSALRLPCARPRDSRARASHSSPACTPSMLSSLRASAPRTFWSILAGPRAPLGLRHLAQQLVEAPAVALEVERLVGAMRLVGAIAPGVVAQPVCDPCTCGDRALIVRIDVVDVHADVLALDAAVLRADRAVVALRADPDHAAAEREHRMVDPAVRGHEPRGGDLAEPERALQERERGADVLIRDLWHDCRSARGLDLPPDCCHEHGLSSVERRRLERGLAPQLPRQVHRLHRDLTLLSPPGSSSSRRCARARLSRERTVPIGSSRASATLWYERSSHAKSRSASRSLSGRPSIASATRGKSRRASSAAALARLSAASPAATIRA